MAQSNEMPIAPDTVPSGPFWPGLVRVTRVEAVGATRIKIEAVSLDGEERLITRLLEGFLAGQESLPDVPRQEQLL